MSVKRYLSGYRDGYADGGFEDCVEDVSGDLVAYTDYAALEARCAVLAAENTGLMSFGDKLDEMHNDLNGEGTGIQGRAEVACQQVALEAAMEEFEAMETPATDAFLAEVRNEAGARAVELFAQTLGSPYAVRDEKCYEDGFTRAIEIVRGAQAPRFAAQIRKGGA